MASAETVATIGAGPLRGYMHYYYLSDGCSVMSRSLYDSLLGKTQANKKETGSTNRDTKSLPTYTVYCDVVSPEVVASDE